MSDYQVEVVELDPTHAVVLPRLVRRTGLGDAIGAAIERVTALLAAARVSPAGPPFVRYLQFGDEVELEVGFPLRQPQAVPSLRSTLLPGGKAVTTWHLGAYGRLTDAFALLEAWVETHARSAGSPWESYWAIDEAQSRIQLVWPVTIASGAAWP